MTPFETALLAFTVTALLWTKALDVISTWRFVGTHGEANPIARWLFEKTGLAGGIGIVCALYLLILGFQIAAVVWINNSWCTYGTVAVGALISVIQYDVARFNCTRRDSILSRILLKICILVSIQGLHNTGQKSNRPFFK
jgi:hypothetical protein